MFNAEKVKNDCIQWIRDFFEENGKDCCAVVGISGGKDSSVVAALCAEALGKDRVVGVLMPCGQQADIDAAYSLVQHLGIRHYEINVKAAVEAAENAAKAVTGVISKHIIPNTEESTEKMLKLNAFDKN